MKRFPLYCVVVAGVLLAAAAQSATFKDGDRVVFFGDSITHGGRYGEYVNLFYATRYPERNIWFSNSGWSGAYAKHGLWSIEDDIVAKRPSVVTVMFGMNDINRHLWPRAGDTEELSKKRRESISTYDARMDELVRRVRAEAGNPEIIYFTPSPYDQTCLVDGKPSDIVCNDGLAILADHVRAWAKRDDATCVDLHATMLAVNSAMQAKDPSASLIRNSPSYFDRVHPGPLGHTVMLYQILKAQGAEGVVDEIERDAGGANSLVFTCTEKALPFPMTDEMRRALDLVPFERDFNREILRIRNLKGGLRYLVCIDGVEVGEWTDVELAAGVNLALNEKTPQYRQAAEAAEICAKLWVGERMMRDFATRRRWMRMHYKADPDAPGAVEKLVEKLLADGMAEDSYEVRSYRAYLKNWPRHAEVGADVEKARASLAVAVCPKAHRFEIVPSRRPVPRTARSFADIDLSGLWRVEGVGVSGEVRLPGTLADAKLGQRWTREMFETTKDRPQSGALVREWQHLGEATYSRVFELSEAEAARPLELFLERVMWASRVEIDGRDLGGRDSLSTPHVYRVGKLAAGRHEIRIAVDNSCRYGFSRNSHSYGPSGQSVWHGVIGRIELRPVNLFASVKVFASAPSGGKVVVKGLPDGFVGTARVEELETTSVSRDGDDIVLALASEPIYWSESTPRLYTLVLSDGDFERRIRFGFRTYGTTRHAVTVNGAKTFIRANIDNCLFPKLGRPPTAKREWLDILRVLKEEDGFNAIRFHSWCPPEAAFDAADELGVYLQPEVCIWSDKWMKPAPQHVGWGDPVDGFVRREFRAICDAYANHPSFMSLAVGNELGGSNWDEADRIVTAMRAYEPRALHFFSSARTIVPSDQLTATHDIPGVGMCRERLFPNTDWDYEDVYAKASIPVIAHEIGQWPSYPDFAGLLPKFDGVMRPWNIDRCEVRSRREGTDRFWREYMAASAHQSRLIYKDEVESFLRTPSCAGVHILDAQDYTGEGEALMGWRDPFFSLKPAYRDMKPFRSIWSKEAALARIAKYDWCVGETFEAKLQVRNQGAATIVAGCEFEWSIVDCSDGSTAARGSFRLPREIASGELGDVGTVRFPIARSCTAKLELRFGENSWPLWAFPNEGKAAVPDGVTATDDFATMRETLSRGGTVLYIGRSRETAEDSFKPVYWSSVWFPTKQPLKETLGTWFEKDHPMLAGFPTEEHSDWQWYGLVNGAIIHHLTGLPQTFRPVALSVNDFHFSLLASSLFELKVGSGRLVVCGYDLESDAPAARRLRASVFEYLSRPPAEGTAEVPLSWLDGFAPLAADGSAASEVVYSEEVDFCGKVFERDVKLSEPVTGFFELAFGATERECSGRGLVDGHSFDIPKGRESRVVRVGIIREDMLDGKLSVRLESADDAPLRLTSLRVVRK